MNRLFTKCLAGGVALAIVVSASAVMALPVYLDLGAQNTPAPSAITWNVLGTQGVDPVDPSDNTGWEVGSAGSSIADLLDSGSSPTGIGVAVTTDFNFENISGGDWAGVPVPWAVNGATSDSFFTNGLNGSQPTGAITFTGLTVGELYNFSAISSRNAAGTRTGTLTLGGADSDSGNSVAFDAFVDGFNPTTGRMLQVWTNVSPAPDGSLELLLTSPVNNGFSYLNAVSFEQIPEPGSIALLGIGMISMLFRGRRRS